MGPNATAGMYSATQPRLNVWHADSATGFSYAFAASEPCFKLLYANVPKTLFEATRQVSLPAKH